MERSPIHESNTSSTIANTASRSNRTAISTYNWNGDNGGRADTFCATFLPFQPSSKPSPRLLIRSIGTRPPPHAARFETRSGRRGVEREGISRPAVCQTCRPLPPSFSLNNRNFPSQSTHNLDYNCNENCAKQSFYIISPICDETYPKRIVADRNRVRIPSSSD